MNTFSLFNFWIPCLTFGVSLSIDIVFATLARFNHPNLSAKNWAAPVTFFHVTFSALGYYVFWGFHEIIPATRPLLGLTGFVLVTFFIYETLTEAIGKKPVFEISKLMARVFGAKEENRKHLTAALAVSWDALLSGPALSAKAIAGQWGRDEIAATFLVIGVVVATITVFVTNNRRRLIREHHNVKEITRFEIMGKYAELSVIGGFGLSSLYGGFFADDIIYLAILASALIMLFIFLIFNQEIRQEAQKEAREMLNS